MNRRRSLDIALPSYKFVGAAAVAAGAAVGGGQGRIGLMALTLQIVLRHAGGDHAPRQQLVLGPGAVGVEMRVKAGLVEGLQPAIQGEILLPGVKVSAFTPRCFQHLSHAAVAPGQDGLQEAGVGVVPVVGDGLRLDRLAQELDAALAAGDFDLALTTLTARCDDPMEYLLPFRGTSESNVCGYRNDTFDLLVGVAESTGDLTARAAFLHDAEAMLLEDSAVSPLCFSGTAYLLREGLTGVSHDCFGHSYFTAVSRAETGPAA